MEAIKQLGRFLYIVSPSESTFEDFEQVPDYVFNQGTRYYLTFILIEFIIQCLRDKRKTRLNDGVTSLSHGVYFGCAKILIRGIEGYTYIYIFTNWKLYDLPWNLPLTWYSAAIGTDFIYYWVHRASHEINLLWGLHQVHHSSEELNLTTAMRQSGIFTCFNWTFYLPLALFIPPPIFIAHQQFSLLFQAWIHTEIVETIGPLELIFNSPKHHRVHHGSNKYCIDRNYGGTLIIWDRIFGTFAEEKPDEKIIYGLVEHVTSFNPFWLQIYYYPNLLKRMKEYPKFSDKLSVLFKGPSWEPGKPRLGNEFDRQLYPIREIFDIPIPFWQNLYVLLNFAVILYTFDALLVRQQILLSQITMLGIVIYILFSLTSIGLVLENRREAEGTELLRCILGIAMILYSGIETQENYVILMLFGCSICAVMYFGFLPQKWAMKSKVLKQ